MYFNQKSILAADYLRLSREDGDKLESDSIRNQRSLINDFVKQHPEITLVDEYVDAPDIIGLKQNPTKRASL